MDVPLDFITGELTGPAVDLLAEEMVKRKVIRIEKNPDGTDDTETTLANARKVIKSLRKL